MSNNLFVGIDIGSSKNVSVFLDDAGQRIGKALSFANNYEGAESFMASLVQIAKPRLPITISIGFEATGIYDWQLKSFLFSHPLLTEFNPKLYQINPKQIRNFKKIYPDLSKTDNIDAFVIADNLRFGRLPQPVTVDYSYFALQRLTRHRFHLMESITAEKTRFLTNLFFKFSNYSKDAPFSNIFGKASSAVILEFCSPEQIASMPVEDLAAFIAEKGKNRFSAPINIAQELQAIIKLSYRLPDPLKESVNFILASSLGTIRMLESQVKAIDKTIERELKPIKHTLLSVDGLGPVLVAGIIAEIGDISRFHDHAALAKFAGLWWKQHQSGNFEAEETRLAKSGNKYLRYYLVEAANCLKIHNTIFKAYYAKKYAEVPKHQHKRALVLLARKLVRVIFSLLRSKKIYELPKTN
ncbi:IS110 family transposase [Patescibacteria group bacterium]|nr:IS110 family transposase [Patescibacteria group bacterium]